MSWAAVIAQERAISALKSAVEHGRVAHAYLFHGPDGCGKRATAMAFAATLFCVDLKAGPSSGDPCGTCPGCQKVAKLIHPDVHFLLPKPKDTPQTEVRRRLDMLVAEPYATIGFQRRAKLDEPGSSDGRLVQYSVKDMNEDVRRAMSFRSVEGGYKLVVLCDAELIRKEAANAFLKLLEEPAERTVFILTSSRPDRILPTILSRCQHLRFDRLAPGEISNALIERSIPDPSMADTIARMADGSFSRALELSESSDLIETRMEVLTFLRGSWTAWSRAEGLAQQIERLSRKGRESNLFLLEQMLGWIRDIALLRTLGPDAEIVNADQSEPLQKFASALESADPDTMARLVEDAIAKLERNVNRRLLLTVLAQSLSAAMRGTHEGVLYPALTDVV